MLAPGLCESPGWSISCCGIYQLLDQVLQSILALAWNWDCHHPLCLAFNRTQERGACFLVTTLGFACDVPEVHMHHRGHQCPWNLLFCGFLPALGGRARLTPGSLGQMSELMLLLLLWAHILRQWDGFTVPDQIILAFLCQLQSCVNLSICKKSSQPFPAVLLASGFGAGCTASRGLSDPRSSSCIINLLSWLAFPPVLWLPAPSSVPGATS